MIQNTARLLCLALLASVTCAESLRAQPAEIGQWSSVINWPIEAIHSVMLPTGKVMVWQTWTTSVGLWDPSTSAFSSITGAGQQASVNPFCAGHAWLPDGRLLVVGGHQANYDGEEETNIYDPFTNSWATTFVDPPGPAPGSWRSSVPDMNATNGISDAIAGRWYPAAVTLGNGEVLALSGDMVVQGVTNPLPQVYNPTTNTWRDLTTAVKTDLPEYPRTFLAPDGRVLVVSDYSNESWLLDTSGTGSWEYVDETLDPELHNYGPGVMYDSGKIAYMGGGNTPTQNVSMIDLNEPSPQWTYGVEDMAQGRRHNNATILADGTVLITGGTSTTGWNEPAGAVSVAEIWDPVTQEMTQVDAHSNIFRGYHSTALLLPDGRVLMTGGNHDLPTYTENKNAEIFSPAYLFAEDGSPAVRPTVISAPDVAELGDTIFVETPDAENITKALWIVPGAVTHAQNWTQRANIFELGDELAIGEGGVNITLPSNGNEAPPGYYMLFLVNEAGVPSMAEWILAEPATPPLFSADFDDDGDVDADDLDDWQAAYQLANGAADADGDGDSDGRDFLEWQRQYGSGVETQAASMAVPEPGAISILLAIGSLIFRRKTF
jgi:hypothetical protein